MIIMTSLAGEFFKDLGFNLVRYEIPIYGTYEMVRLAKLEVMNTQKFAHKISIEHDIQDGKAHQLHPKL